MSLLAQVRAGLDAGWEALDDLRIPVTYVRIARGQHNPATGVTPETVQNVPMIAALVDFKDEQRKSSTVQSGDQMAIFPASSLPFRPQDEDRMVEADGTTWSVKSVAGDKRLYWQLHVRR